MKKIAAPLTLFFLAVLIPELFGASTTLSRANELLIEAFYYGASVVLIREWVRRKGWGWWSVIVLGLAMGVMEEGLLLESVFNPHFLNLDMVYGNAWGVNLTWAEFIIPYHMMWSVTVPIVLTEQLFPEKAGDRWLNTGGVVLMILLGLIGCFLFSFGFSHISNFVTTPAHFVAAGMVFLLLLLLAPWVGRRPVAFAIPIPATGWVAVIGFLLSAVWTQGIGQVFSKQLPWWSVQAGGLLLGAGTILLVSGWIRGGGWSNVQRFHFAWGTFLSLMVSGLFITISQGHVVDIAAQAVFLAAGATVFLVWRRGVIAGATV